MKISGRGWMVIFFGDHWSMEICRHIYPVSQLFQTSTKGFLHPGAVDCEDIPEMLEYHHQQWSQMGVGENRLIIPYGLAHTQRFITWILADLRFLWVCFIISPTLVSDTPFSVTMFTSLLCFNTISGRTSVSCWLALYTVSHCISTFWLLAYSLIIVGWMHNCLCLVDNGHFSQVFLE